MLIALKIPIKFNMILIRRLSILAIPLLVIFINIVFFNTEANSCCDDFPQTEIISFSPNEKYVVMLTPQYHIRSVQNIFIQSYSDATLLTLAEKINKNYNYNSIWQIELVDPGYDWINLYLNDVGFILLITDSAVELNDGYMLTLVNSTGETVVSYTKNTILNYFNHLDKLELDKIQINIHNNKFTLHFDNKGALTIDCKTGNIKTE